MSLTTPAAVTILACGSALDFIPILLRAMLFPVSFGMAALALIAWLYAHSD